VGGIVNGVAQTVGGRSTQEWQILAGHLAFLALLLVRPRGLFLQGGLKGRAHHHPHTGWHQRR